MDERFQRIAALDARDVMQTYRRLPVAFTRGRGTRLWDTEGREYIDLVSGLGVAILGHCHPMVTDAICEQAQKLLHTTNLYYVEPQAQLADLLVENSFPGRCFFANSGAEANEGALKLARKHHFLAGDPRGKVVCLLGSFHGRTLATLSATGQPAKGEPFAPTMPGFFHVPLNDVDALRGAVDSNTAAVMVEPVLGEGGVFPCTAEFLEAAREACDRTGALLLLDEVQTGLGRTGTLYAYQQYGVQPDIMTLAKGLANGVPAATFIAAGELSEVLTPGDHGTTFGGGFLACAAALATLGVIIEERLWERAFELGVLMKERLEAMVDKLPIAVEVRGLGLMLAIELGSDLARRAVLGCLERGVIVNDVSPTAVRLLPPLITTEEEAMGGLDVLEQVLEGLQAEC